MCTVPRAVHALRNVPSALTVEFAERHDEEIVACLSGILGVEVNGVIEKQVAQLSFAQGGLSLKSATRATLAMYWSSWADSLSQMNKRNPLVNALLIQDLQREEGPQAESVNDAVLCAQVLKCKGMDVPNR